MILFLFLVIFGTFFFLKFVFISFWNSLDCLLVLIGVPDCLVDTMFSLDSNSFMTLSMQLQHMKQKRQSKRRTIEAKRNSNNTILSVVNGSISWFFVVVSIVSKNSLISAIFKLKKYLKASISVVIQSKIV